MTGQAFSARTEPNYRHWAVGALFALGLTGSLWYACRAPAKPLLPEEAALEESKPRPVRGMGRQDLVARLEAANSRLFQTEEALRAAGGKIGELNGQIARFRRDAEGRGEYFPPPSIDVRHLGGTVAMREGGDAWLFQGEWFNLGEIIADGYAELQLKADGKLVGEVQKVRIGPIASGGKFPYQATLPRVPGDDSTHYIGVQVVWSQL